MALYSKSVKSSHTNGSPLFTVYLEKVGFSISASSCFGTSRVSFLTYTIGYTSSKVFWRRGNFSFQSNLVVVSMEGNTFTSRQNG